MNRTGNKNLTKRLNNKRVHQGNKRKIAGRKQTKKAKEK
jgi:hypothetical protein